MTNKPWDIFQGLQHPVAPARTGSAHNQIAIIGAGMAGCWLARILAEQGIPVTLYEQHSSVAAAASGNPAGIAKPFVTRSHSHAMSFHCKAHEFLLNRLQFFHLENAAEYTPCGVLQLVEKAYPTSDKFAPLTAEQASEIAKISLPSPALKFTNAGWLNPNKLSASLVKHPLISVVLGQKVTKILPPTHHSPTEQENNRDSELGLSHQLHFENGESADAQHIVLTTGAATLLIPDRQYLPITAARGQISRFSLSTNAQMPSCVVSGKHYVIPDGHSVLVGASFHRDNTDSTVSELDHASNLEGLRQLLPTLKVDPTAIAGYAGVRATTPDRLPIVGPLPNFGIAAETYHDIRHGRPLTDYPPLTCQAGIYLLGGLGSRGIVTAPLCAQLLADYLTRSAAPDEPQLTQKDSNGLPLPQSNHGSLEEWANLINPVRFLIRKLKRGA